ncbi:unnamed protein product [Parascedosporium putredinis]|uniref:Uncharacterized protein n=1 Tax=Parascedosporium putredinis TaxID=1442378 RepID=A0A9P1MAC2_9PEZI|nr:unnamed protein product [Parascedosporium putredinis]CAI7993801.1 unnamed protein product [Parascedosporium putredinis]
MAARFLLAALSIGAATLRPAQPPLQRGCFADQMYRCDDGALNLRGPQKTPFILKTASASAHVDGLVIRACGGYLAIGAGARECHGCQDADGVDCEEYGNQVVLLPNGEMAVDVEGGQEWYIRPSDGTLSYTRPEDTTTEGEGLGGEGVSIFEDGFFAPKSHPYWLSCLRTLPGGTPGTTRSYRLYSPSAPGVADLKCDQVKLVASSADKKDGAFQWH